MWCSQDSVVSVSHAFCTSVFLLKFGDNIHALFIGFSTVPLLTDDELHYLFRIHTFTNFLLEGLNGWLGDIDSSDLDFCHAFRDPLFHGFTVDNVFPFLLNSLLHFYGTISTPFFIFKVFLPFRLSSSRHFPIICCTFPVCFTFLLSPIETMFSSAIVLGPGTQTLCSWKGFRGCFWVLTFVLWMCSGLKHYLIEAILVVIPSVILLLRSTFCT